MGNWIRFLQDKNQLCLTTVAHLDQGWNFGCASVVYYTLTLHSECCVLVFIVWVQQTSTLSTSTLHHFLLTGSVEAYIISSWTLKVASAEVFLHNTSTMHFILPAFWSDLGWTPTPQLVLHHHPPFFPTLTDIKSSSPSISCCILGQWSPSLPYSAVCKCALWIFDYSTYSSYTRHTSQCLKRWPFGLVWGHCFFAKTRFSYYC